MKKPRNKHNGGFTLVEMIGVLAIAAILLGVSVTGYIGYSRYAKYKKNTEYARTIFTAMQSSLTNERSSGTLEEISSKVAGMDCEVPSHATSYNSRLYYLSIQKGDTSSEQAVLLKTLLNGYIYDQTVYDASICVEFDPSDGVVYSVFYHDNNEELLYTEANNAININDSDIRGDDNSLRRQLQLGFWSSELSSQIPGKFGKPTLSYLRLDNSDTLDLNWALSSKYSVFTQFLSYNVKLYDTNNTVRMSFQVNTGNGNNTLLSQSSSTLPYIDCPYEAFDENGNKINSGTISLLAYIQPSDVSVHVVLDSIDIAAANINSSDKTYSYSTTSALKIASLCGMDNNLSNAFVYARVQAFGYGYTSSSWKQSSSQHLFMGKDSTTSRYTLQSARHLFNMRFMCEDNDYLSSVNASYVQTTNLTWGNSGGIIAAGKVYNTSGVTNNGTVSNWTNSIKVTNTQQSFPKIDILNSQQTFTASKTGLTISSLILKSDNDRLGLFVQNNGIIRNLTFSNVDVNGNNYVGTVCVLNNGTINNVTVSSGTVKGNNYVGGIMSTSNASILSGLSNAAEVVGNNYVGGILSVVNNDNISLTVSQCTDYGLVHAVSADSSCIGGIIGYCNAYTTLIGCVSSPNYSGSINSAMFMGTYVGGIAGYNEGTITGCYTTGGYVFGNTYVGGIVGYNKSSVLGDEQVMRNKCSVYANSYVGGIAGCNINSELKNWSNEGVISATTKYCGGIVGANGKDINSTSTASKLSNCISNIDTSSIPGETQLNTAKQFSSLCDYVGGIAGYNNGEISASQPTSCNSVAAGRNYVGGIVGYNDSTAIINNYNISNAYISGDVFVGGYIGLNLSDTVFDSAFSCSARYIEGNYFTGGVIGANIIASDSIIIKCNIDNLQGVLQYKNSSQGAFFGGIVGYSAIAASQTDINTLKAFCTGLYNSVDAQTYDTASANVDSLENSSNIASVSSSLIIGDDSDRIIRLKNITGNIYIGGAVGKNNAANNLTVKNITNYTSVNAYASVTATYDSKESQYSYSGGIIGHLPLNSTINHCTNNYSASINTAGTYRGGLCEINEGNVTNCAADSQGSSNVSCTGGLVGINGGNITSCSVTGSVRGLNYIGGLTAYNYGTITDSTISGDIYGYGENVGGVTGYNKGNIDTVTINSSIYGSATKVGSVVGLNEGGTFTGNILMNPTKLISVQGKKYAGGFIGYNTGANTTLVNLTNMAVVSASDGFAGGILGGMDVGSALSATNCVNNGRISADNGLAGGIVPYLSSNSLISDCENNKQVYAPNSLYYDGNTNSYYNGTLVAFNMGTIQDSSISSGDSDYTITGKGYVGGIVGYNGGTIKNITVTGDHTITVQGEDGALYIGGIAGKNDTSAEIIDCKTDADEGTVIIVTGNTNSCYVGGIAGYNNGNVISSTTPSEYTYSTYVPFRAIVSLNEGIAGYLGGIVGYNNNATLSGYSFEGTLNASGEETHAYGGIVGDNVDSTVSYCVVNDKINTFSTSDMNSTSRVATSATISLNNNALSSLGGIVGRNESGSIVEHCTLLKCYIRGDYGYIGGIVGHNYGEISQCKADIAYRPDVPDTDDISSFVNTISNTNNNVKIYMYRGDLGGITGRNERTGSVDNCATGDDWIVTCSRYNDSNNTESTDNTCAGIIGHNSSDNDITYNENYARVYKGNLSGSYFIASGIIGRQENTTSSTWSIDHCTNYASVECSSARAGGIIAQWKYKGGNITNCTNYGEIKSGNANGVGGMVGFAYLVSSNQVLNITDCMNHGVIISTGASTPAGIFGGISKANNSTVNIVNCINTAKVTGGKNPAGIVNSFDNARVNVLRCVNYYRFPSSENGIASTKVSSLKSCVCVPSITNPIGSAYDSNASQNSTQSYFLSDKNATFSQSGEQTSYDVMLSTPTVTTTGGSEANKSNPVYMTDGDLNTYYNYKLGTGSGNVLSLTTNIAANDGIDRTITLKNFKITFFASTESPREYFYKVYYKLKNDDTLYQISTTGYGNNNQWASTGVINSSNGTAINDGYNKTITIDIPASITQTQGAESIKVECYTNGAISQKSNWLCIAETEITGYYTFTSSGQSSNPDTNKQAVPLYKKTDSALTTVNAANYTYSQADEMKLLQYFPNDTLTHKSYSGYKYWYDLNTSVNSFILSRYEEALGNFTYVTISPENGGYKISWNEVTNALYYDVDIYVDNQKLTTIRVDAGVSTYFMPEASMIGKNAYATVNAYNGATTPQKKSKDSATIKLKASLPEPVVVYELEIENNSLVYYCRLMNVDEYRNIAITQGYDVDAFLENIIITAKLDNTSATPFNALDARVKINNMSGSGSNAVVLEAIADPKSETENTDIANYIQSSRYSVQTAAYSINTIKNTRTIECTNINETAFTGLSPESLQYKIMLRNFKTQAIYRLEFVVNREVAGITIPVVISSSENRMSANGDYYLTGLNDIIPSEPYTVRGYTWKTQSNGLIFGHVVAENITANALLSLNDGYRNTDVITNGVLNSGYSVAINKDGTYNVYYSTAIDCVDKNIGFVNIFYTSGKTVPQRAASPVLSKTYTDNTGSYTFNWTADGTTANDTFKVTLEGTKADNSVVTISKQDVTGYSYTADISTWEYKSVKLSVTRQGIADINGYTTYLGNTGEENYSIPLYLPTIFKPTVFIGSDKNTLTYDISWNNPNSQLALNDIEGYSVMLVDSSNVSHDIADISGSTSTSANVDLESYSGQNVNIYIIARVKSTHTNYTNDSRQNDNETAQLTVSQRLPLSSPVYSLSKDYSSILSVSEFLQGVKLTLINSITIQGSYAMQAAVCNVSSTSDGKLPQSNNRLHDFAVDATTPSTLTMTSDPANSLLKATYDFNTGMQREYAAQYLWFRVRAIPTSGISSIWSPWQVKRLPQVRYDSTDLSNAYNIQDLKVYPDESTMPADMITVRSNTITFTWDEYADKYVINVSSPLSISSSQTRTTQTLVITRTGGEGTSLSPYTYEIKDESANVLPLDPINAQTGLLSYMWNGYLKNYILQIPVTGGTYNYKINTHLNIQSVKVNDQTTVSVVLPDFDEYAAGSTPYTLPIHNTYSISLTAQSASGKYVDSDEAFIYQNYNSVTQAYEWTTVKPN